MVFNKLIERIAEKKAGELSKRIVALKGAEPVVVIGAIASIIGALCKALGIDIDEKAIAEICGGAITLYGAIKALGNYLKNRK